MIYYYVRLIQQVQVLAAAAFLFCISGSANAATWYVDNSVGSSGNGTSWTTAWKNVSTISGVAADNTVYISGGLCGASQTYTPGIRSKESTVL